MIIAQNGYQVSSLTHIDIDYRLIKTGLTAFDPFAQVHMNGGPSDDEKLWATEESVALWDVMCCDRV